MNNSTPGKSVVAEDVAERLGQLWRQGRRPDVDAFLAQAGPLAPDQVAAVLRVDQRERWHAGDKVLAETYLHQHPALQADCEHGLDLVYNEFLLREKQGETPTWTEYAQRFPQFADLLRLQIDLHQAIRAQSHAPDSGGSFAEEITIRDRGQMPQPGNESRATSWPSITGYEVLGELGRGGMGVVYQARQVALDRLVALKMILAGSHAGEQERARFRTEGEAVARLQHPHIVQIYEVGEAEGRPFFSLEYVDGGNLEKKLGGTPLPARQAAELVETLARTIHVAHQHQLIHRDLKPANVLLTSDGIPKITDFGLAKELDSGGPQTQSGAIVGTPSYMAPEQAGGKAKAIGPATDVYALGAILYECLTGRPPFRAETPLDTVLLVVSEEPVPPTRLQPKLPRDLEIITLKCLEKEPGKRYASAEDLAADLRHFLNQEPIRARPSGVGERIVKWVRRRPAVAALLAVLAAVILGGFVSMTGLWLRAEDQRSAAERAKDHADRAQEQAQQRYHESRRHLYVAHMHLAMSAWRDARVGPMTDLLQKWAPGPESDPGGSLSAEDLLGFEWRYLNRLCHGSTLRTFRYPGKGYFLGVALSPDGKLLAAAGGSIVAVWDWTTGQEIATLQAETKPCSVAFNPDGRNLASGDRDGRVTLWDLASQRPLRRLAQHLEPVFALTFSPDGRRLATGGGDDPRRPDPAAVWDVATGTKVFALMPAVDALAFSPDGSRLATTYLGGLMVWDAVQGAAPLFASGRLGASAQPGRQAGRLGHQGSHSGYLGPGVPGGGFDSEGRAIRGLFLDL